MDLQWNLLSFAFLKKKKKKRRTCIGNSTLMLVELGIVLFKSLVLIKAADLHQSSMLLLFCLLFWQQEGWTSSVDLHQSSLLLILFTILAADPKSWPSSKLIVAGFCLLFSASRGGMDSTGSLAESRLPVTGFQEMNVTVLGG